MPFSIDDLDAIEQELSTGKGKGLTLDEFDALDAEIPAPRISFQKPVAPPPQPAPAETQEETGPTWLEAVGGSAISSAANIMSGAATFGRGLREAYQQGEQEVEQRRQQKFIDFYDKQLESGEITADQHKQLISSVGGEPSAAYQQANQAFFDPANKMSGQFLQNIEDFYDPISEKYAPKYYGTFLENPSVKRGVSALVQGGVSMAVAIPVSVIAGPEAGAAILSGSESGGMYKDAIAAGKSPKEALDFAMKAGIATFALEKFGLEQILEATGGVASRFLKGAIAEAGTEDAQTLVQNAIAKHGYDESIGYLDGIIESTIGGLAGGPAAAVFGGHGETDLSTGQPVQPPIQQQEEQPAPEREIGQGIVDAAVEEAAAAQEAAAQQQAQQPEAQQSYPEIQQEEQETESEAVTADQAAVSAEELETDLAAHEAATSPTNDKPEPTEAQIKAGNYAKGHVNIQGLDVTIENPAGSVRKGTDEDGKAWETKLTSHYGYLKRTEGSDGDQLDVFLAPGAENAESVFIIDQVDPRTGEFDEHKTVIGPKFPEGARTAYLANYDQSGQNRIGAITEMPMDEFKAWAKNGDTTKPVSKEVMTNEGQRKQGEGQGEGRPSISCQIRQEPGDSSRAAPSAG